jgi:hypothetical protein
MYPYSVTLHCSLPEDFEDLKSQFLDRLLQRGYSMKFLKPIFNQQFQTRTKILQELTISASTRTKMDQQPTLQRDPVAIVNLPKLHTTHFNTLINQLFTIPSHIRAHPYYAKAFPNSHRKIPIIARKLGKNLFRLIDVDKFSSMVPPRREQCAPTEENPLDPLYPNPSDDANPLDPLYPNPPSPHR